MEEQKAKNTIDNFEQQDRRTKPIKYQVFL